MIRTLYYSTQKSQFQFDLPIDQIDALLKDPDASLWVDFQGNPPEMEEPILREKFGFHPLAIEDALQQSHVPKIDDWGKYLYIVLHALTFRQHSSEELETHELDIFLGENYLVTHHDEPIPSLDHVWNNIQRDDRHIKLGVDHILYRLTDEIVASYMPVVEQIDEAVDNAEDQIFSKPTDTTLSDIFRLKRSVLHLRRIISPQREVLNKLARDDYQVIDARDRIYFRDVYDHLVRLHDITESLRDLVGGALDTYLSVINNRMNEIMKTLTLITTMFMPISFVAGFFGMNFFVPDPPLSDWVSPQMYAATLVIIVLTPFVLYLWARRRGWMR